MKLSKEELRGATKVMYNEGRTMKEDTELDTINKLMSTQLSEREAIFYMLCDENIPSSMSFRELGKRLGVSHENIRTTYNTAKAKIQAQADAGLFVTEI